MAGQFVDRLLATLHRFRCQVTGNIARRNPRKTEHADGEVSKVLAHPAPRGQDFVEVRMHAGGSPLVVELVPDIAHRASYVLGDVLALIGSRRPEEFPQSFAERYVAAGVHEIILLFATRIVVGEIFGKAHTRKLRLRFGEALHERLDDDGELLVRRVNRNRMDGVTESVFVFENRCRGIAAQAELKQALTLAGERLQPKLVVRLVGRQVIAESGRVDSLKTHCSLLKT